MIGMQGQESRKAQLKCEVLSSKSEGEGGETEEHEKRAQELKI
jgi:hypothetical protein